MLGERVTSVEIEARGVVGDRLWAVRDAAGKLGSGKNSHRFRRMDGLLRCRAAYRAAGPLITLPDGSTVAGAGADVALRRELRRPDVSLARESTDPHFDDAPLHLVTTATLA